MSFLPKGFQKAYVPFVRPTDARQFRGSVPHGHHQNNALLGSREND